MLRAAIPRLTADVNSLYAPYSAQSDQVVSLPQPDYAQRMIGWRAGEAFTLYVLADALASHGAYDRALPFARESVALSREMAHMRGDEMAK